MQSVPSQRSLAEGASPSFCAGRQLGEVEGEARMISEGTSQAWRRMQAQSGSSFGRNG